MPSKIKALEITDISSIPPDKELGPAVIVDQVAPTAVLSLYINNKVRHVIQKSNLAKDVELDLASEMIFKPRQFIDFPLSSIFNAEKPDLETEKKLTDFSFCISSPSEKISILDKLEEIGLSQGNLQSTNDDIRTVTDEMITNAIFNAPFAQGGQTGSRAMTDRSSVEIDKSKKPCVFMGHDENRIIIGCRDLYGSLNTQSFIERIYLCFQKDLGSVINYGAGGAGIGSYMMFDSCIGFYVAVDEGKSTTVICSFPRKMSVRQRQKIPKNLHVIVVPSDSSSAEI